MQPELIAELLGPFFGAGSDVPLSRAQLEHISTYIDLLLRWNARVNLTAVRDPENVVTRHFGESLFAARHLCSSAANDQGRTTKDLIDVGSGAGFPGLPIKIWTPDMHLTLIESNHKKATFLREVVRALKLTDVDVFNRRAEDFPAGSADIVTLRAVEHFEAVLPVAAQLVKPAGRIALLIGEAQIASAQRLLPAYRWDTPLPIPLSSNRVLLAGSARGEPEQ